MELTENIWRLIQRKSLKMESSKEQADIITFFFFHACSWIPKTNMKSKPLMEKTWQRIALMKTSSINRSYSLELYFLLDSRDQFQDFVSRASIRENVSYLLLNVFTIECYIFWKEKERLVSIPAASY